MSAHTRIVAGKDSVKLTRLAEALDHVARVLRENGYAEITVEQIEACAKAAKERIQ